jgi:hypothetical protein
LSSCRPPCMECVMPWRCVWDVASTSAFRLMKSVNNLFPRSTPMMG